MTNSQRLAAVRLRLQQWLAQQSGADEDVASSIRGESILIRDGFYCGRQFDAGPFRGVWFMEEDELKISTSDGNWVCTLQGESLVPLPEKTQRPASLEVPAAVIPITAAASDAATDLGEGPQPNESSSDEKAINGTEIRRAA